MHDRMPIDGNGPSQANTRIDNPNSQKNPINQQYFQNDMNIYDQQHNNSRSLKNQKGSYEN